MNNAQTNQIKNNLNDKATAASENATDKLESLYGNARETLSNASEKISHGYDVASEELKKAGSQFEGLVRKNPLVAVSIAAGMGWALGRLLAGNKSNSDRA